MKANAPAWAAGGFAALVLATAGVMATHYEGQRSHAYQDPAGIWTICMGHTDGVQPGAVAKPDECMQYLQTDMASAYGAVQRCITASLTVGQAAAFSDAVFNAGPAVVCGSTLQRMANAGDLAGACDQLNRWTKVGGVISQGLVNRRAAEYALCVGGIR